MIMEILSKYMGIPLDVDNEMDGEVSCSEVFSSHSVVGKCARLGNFERAG